MNTQEYLDAVKNRLGIDSDYALAKRLGIRQSTLSGYRARNGQMDDEIAAKVADLLGIHPGLVMLDMHRARAKTPVEASIWQDIYAGFRAPSLHAKSSLGNSPAW
ncbi:hypothetical protein [Duganella violaceipulchra]|uniref:DNA-binding transcriptional regulator YdaS (Cro superfamily) n=1 Tax=Duganella violaceipulchra TaxID=2849652 RepID=A0AA41HG23_9BURK|nr:hypothetical protein [Duganella violaceicalia]MBV6324377.1 hypothetical protein [Duganella violaceicalia]MCP2007228.1 DNA-binding transcriptional regulator YdaS (Cro superfamily) [Duganella violaceicalia]